MKDSSINIQDTITRFKFNTIREFIVVLVIMGIIDMIFLKIIVDLIWKDMIKDIQVSAFKPNLAYIPIPYLLMTIGIVIFILPHIREDNVLGDSIFYGGLLGLIIYGVFDSTNLVLFSRYKLGVGILDTIWGVILFSVVTFLSKKTLLFFKDLL